MIARLVRERDDARVALGVSFFAAVGLLAVLADDLWDKSLFRPPSDGSYVLVAALIVLSAIAPWLAVRRRGRAVHVRCADGVVLAGTHRIAAGEVSALSVVAAARGKSVAIGRGKTTVFLEVERAEDAARIAETLGVTQPPRGEISATEPTRMLAFPQLVLSVVALVFAPFYYVAATGSYPMLAGIDAKALFGVGGVLAAELAMILLVVRRVARGNAVAVLRSAWDAHVALHRAGASGGGAVDAPSAVIGSLARGDEEVRAWLARLDALPADPHAYRGDAMKRDVLWDTLGDVTAAVDARMGAARVLRQRYGERADALVRVVADPDVRVRVEAALEAHDDAERQLETLGPLFRAR